MHSVRKYTKGHGNTLLKVLFLNLIVTAVFTWQIGTDYIIIFCSSSILILIIETFLAFKGIRKGEIYVYGRKLPRVANLLLSALVEGPAFCVPAFFVADQFQTGRIIVGIAGSVLVVCIGSLYMGLADRRDLRRLGPGKEPLISRRAMTQPGAVMLLALINTGCLTALFLMPAPYRVHAFTFVIAYSLLVMLFYLINYNLGVRMLEIYDHKRGEYTMPGPLFQTAGLVYDSAYEMALLMSASYWITFYLGLFNYTMIT